MKIILTPSDTEYCLFYVDWLCDITAYNIQCTGKNVRFYRTMWKKDDEIVNSNSNLPIGMHTFVENILCCWGPHSGGVVSAGSLQQ